MRKAALYLALSGCFFLALVLESLFTRSPEATSDTVAAVTLGGDGELVEIPQAPPEGWAREDTTRDDARETAWRNERRSPEAGGSQKPKPTPPEQTGRYLVRSGDSLWSIAESQLGQGNRWPEIAALNGLNKSSVLKLNRRLKIPPKDGPPPPAADEPPKRLRTHVVAAGDTLGGLALHYLGTHSRWPEIRELNGLPSDSLEQGLVLSIPDR